LNAYPMDGIQEPKLYSEISKVAFKLIDALDASDGAIQNATAKRVQNDLLIDLCIYNSIVMIATGLNISIYLL
jgi:tetrahydromethanopterin S-methyltransferase subunit H